MNGSYITIRRIMIPCGTCSPATSIYFKMAGGNRDETIQFSGFLINDLIYKMSNVKNGLSGDIAFLTCDVEVTFKEREKTNVVHALEAYIFGNQAGGWKMFAKSVAYKN